ncbi:hypothetical protein COV17_04570 [Candidatus Woesearchaeota archaeon CG10_big_fil_rev_8_21_14_0_10_36_11]|nr:MAG: hypothetical protein COV17_04570 [Candidatus Woesearchaeota archaeon CG10_big_fil_rev_8_21_14_0_10_36_11]
MLPTFSVIIPAHNEENYIRQTLHSFKKQTFQDFEIIVVTNGCTDKTEDVVKKRVNAKLQHFNTAVANVSRARNYGAGKAAGEILVFCDADTVLENDSLQKIREMFTPGISVATTRVRPDSQEAIFRFLMTLKNVYNRAGLYKGCSGVLVCQRKDFDTVNGYDPEIVVKEHSKLTHKLLTLGKYTCVNTTATTSMRRLKQWGIGKAFSFWARQWVKHFSGNLESSEYEKIR